ncbi:oxidoreductase, short-chain dehydrogenase/reductase family [Labilithrix luteola]|uniref:Oxidoreductase, short-chain dehydrogenase/reductase family n=1 Tax=Labilithrix luteola TaxID=1391654 RepID=A0A0K1PWK9_9BACT|nr:SDR family oxidoreductase [Labilithrix luteola]AKU97756.1 oxidoreductase, short-chain dehydrogenase/reductase family [Labilithrix luteola]
MSADVFREGLLDGKHAFVTGGTSGINLAIAARYVAAGAKVTVLGRNVEKAQAAASELGPRALAVTADVRDYAAVDQALRTSVEKHGPIDVLVCGAAGNFPAPAVGMSANGFKAVVDIDLLGTFNTCRAAFELMTKPSSIVAISATQASHPTMLQSHVCAAKAGVEMLVRVLAMEWGSSGVRVNAIAPGPIAGTIGMEKLAPTEDIRRRVEASIPLGRMGTTREIADMALFLASSAASYVTGGVFVVDGGQSLGGFGNGLLG